MREGGGSVARRESRGERGDLRELVEREGCVRRDWSFGRIRDEGAKADIVVVAVVQGAPSRRSVACGDLVDVNIS